MVNISFDADTGKVRRSNGTFLENVGAMEEKVAERFADDLEETVKQSVRNKFDRFNGKLHDNVEAKKKGSTGEGTRYELTANAYNQNGVNYAAWHEYAEKPHFVTIEDSNRPIDRWARRKGINAYGITVTPMNKQRGSFMAPAVRKAIKKARRRMRSGKSAPSTALQAAFKG